MEEIILSNGVKLIVEDKTAILTADLYMIHLKFTTAVDLDDDDAELREFVRGDQATLVRELKKPAVHEREVDEVRDAIKESFLATNLPYMERPRFIDKFKAKMLKDFREEQEKKKRSHG
jgi:hypothetical protein